jgi:hypothetical protein
MSRPYRPPRSVTAIALLFLVYKKAVHLVADRRFRSCIKRNVAVLRNCQMLFERRSDSCHVSFEMYSTVNNISQLQYFNPNYPTSRLTVTGIVRVYCNRVGQEAAMIPLSHTERMWGAYGTQSQLAEFRTWNARPPARPPAFLQMWHTRLFQRLWSCWITLWSEPLGFWTLSIVRNSKYSGTLACEYWSASVLQDEQKFLINFNLIYEWCLAIWVLCLPSVTWSQAARDCG